MATYTTGNPTITKLPLPSGNTGTAEKLPNHNPNQAQKPQLLSNATYSANDPNSGSMIDYWNGVANSPLPKPSNNTMQNNPLALRDFAKANNYNISFDPKESNVTLVHNPTGQSISFKNGQGDQYGIGFNNGTHYINDVNKLTGAFNNQFNNNVKSGLASPSTVDTSAYTKSNNVGATLPQPPTNNGQVTNTQTTVTNTNNSQNNGPNLQNANYEDQKKLLTDASNASVSNQIALLQQAIANSKSKFQKQLAELPDQYNNLRGSAWNTSQSALKGNAERMASMGMMGSGYSDNMNAQTLNNLANQDTQYNTSQARDTRDLNDQISQLEMQQALAESAIRSGADQTLASNLLSAYNNTMSQNNQNAMSLANYGLGVAGLTGNYNGQRTLQGQQLDQQTRSAIAEMTGYDPVTGQATANTTQFNKNYDLNRAGVTGYMPDGTPIMAQQQFNTIQTGYMPNGQQTLTGRSTDANIANMTANTALTNQDIDKNNLLKPYIVPTAQADLQGKQLTNTGLDLSNKGQSITNALNQIKLDNAPEEAKLNMKILQQAVDQGDIKTASDKLVYMVQNKYLDLQTAASIEATIKDANAKVISANASAQNASTNAGQLALAQDEYQSKKAAGLYDPELTKLEKQTKLNDLETKQVDDAIKLLSSQFMSKKFNPQTMAEEPVISGDPAKIRQAIIGYGLNDKQTKAMLAYFGQSTEPAK